MVPLALFSGHSSLTSAGSACATTGATCMKCVPDSCGLLGYGQTLYYRGTYTYSRCIDFDKIAPGHCSAVMHNQYSILDINRNGYWNEVGTCLKADCGNGTIYTDRACDNPLYL
jgi:hypothetical protein